MRNKLIELMKSTPPKELLIGGVMGITYGDIADHLIANGAILPEFLKIRETKYIPPFDFDEENSRPNVLVFLACGEKTFSLAVPITSGKSISCLGCLYLEKRQQKCNRCSRSYYMRDYYTQEPPQEEV